MHRRCEKFLGLVLCFLSLWTCSCRFCASEKLQGTWRRFTVADGLIGDDIRAVATDNHGNVWFATGRGVSVLTAEGEWTHYQASDGLGADKATAIIIDRRGRVWVAAIGGGVSRFDGVTWRTFSSSNSGLPDDSIEELALDAQDNVWVLSSKSGLSVIRGDDSVTYVGNPFPQGIGTFPYFLTIDSGGYIWVATFLDTLLAAYDPVNQQWQSIERVTEHVDLPTRPANPPNIWGIAADLQPGHLWIASNRIVEVSDEGWRIHLPQYHPSAVFVDPDGYKWFGVSGPEGVGLLLLSPDSQQWWFCRGEVFGNIPYYLGMVREIMRDSQGNYWFTTFFDAVQFIPNK